MLWQMNVQRVNDGYQWGSGVSMEFEIYCDESRHDYFARPPGNGERYVLLGGLWIEAKHRDAYKIKIGLLRRRHDVRGEFKWNRVSPSRIRFYLSLVDFFFEEAMRFRCIVLPADQVDSIRFHRSDNELMFYKFYYQLLHHWILDFNDYRIFLDLKTNRLNSRINTLHRVLQNANLMARIISVQALPSRQVDLLQLSDVLLGAVGYKFHRLETSQAKVAVVKRIETHLGGPIEPTWRDERKFNVFRFLPGGGW
jgi:hypothetical protein